MESDLPKTDRRLDWLLGLPAKERLAQLSRLSPEELGAMAYDWPLWARANQLPPKGDWRLWLVMAGRGFGKTRMGSEWVRMVAQSDPMARIALVAASLGEARSVMVEGESGILACSPSRRRPRFEPSLRRLVWPHGAVATLYSAAEPDSLRGPSTAMPGATKSPNGIIRPLARNWPGQYADGPASGREASGHGHHHAARGAAAHPPAQG
jgi:hypothetical protein